MADWQDCGEAGQGAYGGGGKLSKDGFWNDSQRKHAHAEARHAQATRDGDREGAWQAHLDMLEANGYHVPERTGKF